MKKEIKKIVVIKNAALLTQGDYGSEIENGKQTIWHYTH